MTFDLRRTPPLVLAIHDGMRLGLMRGGIPGDAIRIIRNPIRAFTRQRITAEHNRELVFIGRLHPEKGLDLAAKPSHRSSVQLRIIGDGPILEALRRDHPEVVFAGRRSEAEIGGLIASARALLMSSQYPEPFRLVAGEAL